MGIDVNKVRRLREAKGLTLDEAATKAGMNSRQQWYGVESGDRANPSIDTVQRIAKALGCKVDDLLK